MSQRAKSALEPHFGHPWKTEQHNIQMLLIMNFFRELVAFCSISQNPVSSFVLCHERNIQWFIVCRESQEDWESLENLLGKLFML